MISTNDFFLPGKIAITMDAAAGSSGKGKISAFLAKHASNLDFVCNNNFPQASHTVVDVDKIYVYKQLNSSAHHHKNFKKMYIGHGSVIDVDSLLKEIKMSGLPPEKLGIDPLAIILQPADAAYERGEVGFDGETLAEKHSGTMKYGSTCSGVGAARARKVLRRPNLVLARDVKELQPFICNVSEEILARLAKGQAGMLDLPQGFQLSYGLGRFFPHCTSRNITVAAGLDDMMLPVTVVGNVLLNLRSFPIRIASKKYIGKDGKHLTWKEVQAGIPHDVIDSNSGAWYPDQRELTWEELTDMAGSDTLIAEYTTLTKLPRRVATFSKINLKEAIIYNQTPHKIFLSLNFVNYISSGMTASRDSIDTRTGDFLNENILPVIADFKNVQLKYLGTSAQTDDFVVLE